MQRLTDVSAQLIGLVCSELRTAALRYTHITDAGRTFFHNF